MSKKLALLTAFIMAGFLGTGISLKCKEHNAHQKVLLSEQNMQDSINKGLKSKVISLTDTDHNGCLDNKEQTELWFRVGNNECPGLYGPQVSLDYILGSADSLRKVLESYRDNPESIYDQVLYLGDKNHNQMIDPEEKPYTDSLISIY